MLKTYRFLVLATFSDENKVVLCIRSPWLFYVMKMFLSTIVSNRSIAFLMTDSKEKNG